MNKSLTYYKLCAASSAESCRRYYKFCDAGRENYYKCGTASRVESCRRYYKCNIAGSFNIASRFNYFEMKAWYA